ncbi:hypothetical protein [Microbacterium sp. 5K110]|jgi:hypothetical protein|nr:hypothetical protein [Microbacterium sp. 5K110]
MYQLAPNLDLLFTEAAWGHDSLLPEKDVRRTDDGLARVGVEREPVLA